MNDRRGTHENLQTATLKGSLYVRGNGFSASSPTTVVHSRTRHFVTRPLVTYGSPFANASAAAGDEPLNNRTVPSMGLASAPPSTRSPFAIAFCASARLV